jgi:hypothetical protein
VNGLSIPRNALRASLVRQFLTCGKKNCRCHSGMKHGPFYYLVQCAGIGSVRKYLLKTPTQRDEARKSIASYRAFQEQMEELSKSTPNCCGGENYRLKPRPDTPPALQRSAD